MRASDMLIWLLLLSSTSVGAVSEEWGNRRERVDQQEKKKLPIVRRESKNHKSGARSIMEIGVDKVPDLPEKVALEEVSDTTSRELCRSLLKVVKERGCKHFGVVVSQERSSQLQSTELWPVQGCDLPMAAPIFLDEEGAQGLQAPNCSFIFAASAGSAEKLWAAVPAGGVLVVPLQKGAASKNGEVLESDSENLIWQALYQVNTELYFPVAYSHSSLKFDLPELRFTTFIPGHALLQKADGQADIANSNGTFFNLARNAGTDKVDALHNYSLLYHRHLDEAHTCQEIGSMMLEIGLGCTLEPGNPAAAGASAKVWPHLFPNAAVHFVEIDRECMARWEPQMRDIGVAKVHIGGQADPTVLAEVIHDANFAKPGGFCGVVDDGSHRSADIEASFRTLLPHLKKGGLYFVEDIMYSQWNPVIKHSPHVPILTHKHNRSSASPVALAAVLAARVTGVAEMSNPTVSESVVQQDADADAAAAAEYVRSPIAPEPDTTFWGPIADRVNVLKTRLLDTFPTVFGPFLTRPKLFTWDAPSASHPDEWRKEILSSTGSLVDFIECSPGICVFRRS